MSKYIEPMFWVTIEYKIPEANLEEAMNRIKAATECYENWLMSKTCVVFNTDNQKDAVEAVRKVKEIIKANKGKVL